MRIEVFYRCNWCTWLIRVSLSLQEWEQMDKRPLPTIEHHCRGEVNRHGVASLVGWKEVEEETEGEDTNGEIGDPGRDFLETHEDRPG